MTNLIVFVQFVLTKARGGGGVIGFFPKIKKKFFDFRHDTL
jgi:hypothetical protein